MDKHETVKEDHHRYTNTAHVQLRELVECGRKSTGHPWCVRPAGRSHHYVTQVHRRTKGEHPQGGERTYARWEGSCLIVKHKHQTVDLGLSVTEYPFPHAYIVLEA